MKWIARLLSIYVVFFCLNLGLLFFTTIPFEFLAKVVSHAEVFVVGISGSLYNGLKISEVTFGNVDSPVYGKYTGIEFQYKRLADLLFSRKLIIDKMAMNGIDITVTGKVLGSSPPPAAAPVPVATPTAGEAKALADSKAALEKATEIFKRAFLNDDPWIREFRIGEIRFSNFKVTQTITQSIPSLGGVDPTRFEKFEFKEVSYKDFVFANGIKFGEMNFISERQEYHAKGFAWKKGSYPRIEEVSATMRKAFDPDYISNDLDLKLEIAGTPQAVKDVEMKLSALGGKIGGKFGPNSRVDIDVHDLTVRDFYRVPLPITHLNLEIRSPQAIGTSPMLELAGSFQIGTTRFNLSPLAPIDRSVGMLARASAMVGRLLYTIEFLPAVHGGMTTPIRLRSTRSESAQDNLAALYFSGNYADLDALKRLQIDTDLKYFDRSVPPFAKYVPVVRRAASRMPASSARPRPNYLRRR